MNEQYRFVVTCGTG